MTTKMATETGARTGAARIAVAYLLTAISLGVGALPLAGALVAGQNCDLDGFACLGWLIWGALAGAALASVALIILSLRQKMGIWFPIIMIAMIILALAIPGIEWLRVLMVLLAPGVAAWITAARGRSANAPQARPARGARNWLLRGLALVVILGLAPVSVAVKDVHRANYRESLYAKEGVAPLGLSDDSDWDYHQVMEDVVARGFSYQLVDAKGRQLQVEIRLAEDSDFQPPRNCSSDPKRSAPCETRAAGVFRSEGEQRQHRVVVRGSSVAELRVQAGAFGDAELDRLAIALQPQSARWLAERSCTICSVLPG